MRRCASSSPWPPSSGGMKPGTLTLSVRLREALSGGECEMVEALLQQGANPNLVLPEGIAAIHLAAGMEQESGIQCLGLILQYGGDPNIRSVDGLTPLHVAAAWGRYTCLKLLLMEGGDPHLEDQDGNTAIDLALEEGNEMCVCILQGFLKEAGEGQRCWMSCRREESFLSTVTEDTLNPGRSSRICDPCPVPLGRSSQPPPSESLWCARTSVLLPRPSKSQDEICSFEDTFSPSFLTECSSTSSTLCHQGDLCAQPAASSCSASGLGQLPLNPSAAQAFPINRPEHPKPDLGTIQTCYVRSTTAKGSPLSLDLNSALSLATLIGRESHRPRDSLEVQNANRSPEIPRPSPTRAIVSKCEADPLPSVQESNTTLNLSQYSSFLDPDLVVRVTCHEGLDVTSPDHAYLFSRAKTTNVSDLEKTVLVSAEFLPGACRNLGGGFEGDRSFSGNSSSGQYASCNSQCYASTTEAPCCSEAQTQEGREASLGCSPCSSHNAGSNSSMSQLFLGPSSGGLACWSGKKVEAISEMNSPAKSDCPRPLCDRIGGKGACFNACTGSFPLDLCSSGKDERPKSGGQPDLSQMSQGGVLAKRPLQKWGNEELSTPPLKETQKPRVSGAEIEHLSDASSSIVGRVDVGELQGKAKGTGPPEAQAKLSTEETRGGIREFQSTSPQDAEECLWTQDTVPIQKASEEMSSLDNKSPDPPGMSWDAADTIAAPHQTPPSTREDEPTSLEAKLRSMMLAPRICHSPLLQPHRSPRHVTPRTKSRLMASAAHDASSSSSLFDETLEMPQRPRRWRNPRGVLPASGERQDWSDGPRNSSLPGVAGEENSELDDTVLIVAGLGSGEPGSCTVSLPLGCALASLDTLASRGRDVCRGDDQSDIKPSSDHAADLKEEVTLEDKLPPGNREEACTAQESLDIVLPPGDPEWPRARHGRTKRQANHSRVSFSRLPVPRASTCPSGQKSPVAQDVQLSPGGRPVNLSATEPVEYLYEDEGHTLVERHIPCTDDAVANTTSSEDTVIYDWRAYTSQAAGPTDKGSRSPSAASELCHLSDEVLVRQLRDFGVNPGPVTGLTRKVYLQLLEKLMNDPKTKARKGSAGYSPELSSALDTYQIPDGQEDEMALARQFDQPDKSRKWREGLLKSSFNYLLLDPRVTQNLPFRGQYISRAECFRTFVSAIFYVGKGKRSRPYCHLYEALTHYQQNQRKRGGQACSKVQHILEIWASGQGVISMHCFQNVIPVEAYTREASMVDAIGLKMLTNQKKGNYYGVVADWPMKRRRCLGVHLLHRAMQIFLAEGERQLRPADIRTGQ